MLGFLFSGALFYLLIGYLRKVAVKPGTLIMHFYIYTTGLKGLVQFPFRFRELERKISPVSTL